MILVCPSTSVHTNWVVQALRSDQMLEEPSYMPEERGYMEMILVGTTFVRQTVFTPTG